MRTVKEFVDGGLLEDLQEETFLIYAQRTSRGDYQVGVLAALDLEDCHNNVVKKHELCVPSADSVKSTRTKHFQVIVDIPGFNIHLFPILKHYDYYLANVTIPYYLNLRLHSI
jgi:uncharacterized protein (DUF1015 family)